MRKLVFILLLFLVSSSALKAQYFRDNITVAVGPAMMYGDNTGGLRTFKFKTLPAISVSHTYELNQRWDLRTTMGTQMIGSGGNYLLTTQERWGEHGQAFSFNGQAYYVDAMAVYQLNPNIHKKLYRKFNFYMGAGIGAMYVDRTQRVNTTFMEMEGERPADNILEEEASTTTAYIPLRFGVNHMLNEKWGIGLDLTNMIAASSDVDGNTMRSKRVKADLFFQAQVKVMRYLWKEY